MKWKKFCSIEDLWPASNFIIWQYDVSQFIASVVIHSFWVQFKQNIDELPKNLNYSIRFPNKLRTRSNWLQIINGNWQTNKLYSIESNGGPRGRFKNEGDAPKYFREGFIPVQAAIAQAFVKSKTGNVMPSVTFSVSAIHSGRYNGLTEKANSHGGTVEFR